MDVRKNGMLVLRDIPNPEVEGKVEEFLSHYYKNDGDHKLAGLIKKTPLVLSRNADEKAAETFVARLEKLGASAVYIPKTTISKTTPARGIPIDEEPRSVQIPEPTSGTDLPDFSFTPDVNIKQLKTSLKARFLTKLFEVNKELWVIFSLILIVGAMNYCLTSQRMLLGLYTLPTLFSAYFYGRRHATLTAMASVILVGIAIHFNPAWLAETKNTVFLESKWYEIMAWGGILMITAYAMGTLYDRDKKKVVELREAYQGILIILRRFISNDQYTENHCYRVSIYAPRIAFYLGFSSEMIENLRSAAMLHDIGKLEISRKILYKAAHLSNKEYDEMKQHVRKSNEILQPVVGPLDRVLPIILAHHERVDGSGYSNTHGDSIPVEACVLAVADVYDSLTSDRPYRKAMSPFEAKDIIVKGSGTEFDPKVVNAFVKAFTRGEMEIPNVVV